jgi:hypothetical protein
MSLEAKFDKIARFIDSYRIIYKLNKIDIRVIIVVYMIKTIILQ